MSAQARFVARAAFVVLVLFVLGGAAPEKLAGPITTVDVKARTLTLRDSDRGEATLLVDDASVIVLDGDDKAVLEDLFPGDRVDSATVRELNGGRLLLLRAVVTSGPGDEGDEPDEDDEPEDGESILR